MHGWYRVEMKNLLYHVCNVYVSQATDYVSACVYVCAHESMYVSEYACKCSYMYFCIAHFILKRLSR